VSPGCGPCSRAPWPPGAAAPHPPQTECTPAQAPGLQHTQVMYGHSNTTQAPGLQHTQVMYGHSNTTHTSNVCSLKHYTHTT